MSSLHAFTSTPIALDDLADRYPHLAQRLEEVREYLDRRRWVSAACEHVHAGKVHLHRGLAVCAGHLARGVWCLACVPRHINTHSAAFEHLCDECLTVDLDAEMTALVGTITVVGLEVRRRDRRGTLTGPIQVLGLGIGPCCRSRAD